MEIHEFFGEAVVLQSVMGGHGGGHELEDLGSLDANSAHQLTPQDLTIQDNRSAASGNAHFMNFTDSNQDILVQVT